MRTRAGRRATEPQQVVSARRRTNADLQRDLDQALAAHHKTQAERDEALAERDEAQARETATAEVLRVINASPGDLGPVFDAILQKAHDLCDAALGSLVTFDGTHFRALTTHGYPEQFAALMRRPFPPSIYHRPVLDGERFVHLPDFQAAASGSDHEVVAAVVREVKARSFLAVPLRKDGVLLGLISATRLEVRPFSDKEIALLESFAAQAVIAMENARLLTETREALDQQTATAEVLQVINSSPGDLAPVFGAMLEKALHLCEAACGALLTYDRDSFNVVAMRGVPPSLEQVWRQPQEPAPGTALARIVRGEDIVHTADMTESDAYRSGAGTRRAYADLGGARSAVWVALRQEDSLLGAMTIYRQEVRPFTDKQIVDFHLQAVVHARHTKKSPAAGTGLRPGRKRAP